MYRFILIIISLAVTTSITIDLKSQAIKCYQNLCHAMDIPLNISGIASCGANTKSRCIQFGTGFPLSDDEPCYTISLPHNYCKVDIMSNVLSSITNSLISNGGVDLESITSGCIDNFCQEIENQPNITGIAGCFGASSVQCLFIKTGTEFTHSSSASCYVINFSANLCGQSINLDKRTKDSSVNAINSSIAQVAGANDLKTIAVGCYRNFCSRTGPQMALSKIAACPSGSGAACVLIGDGVSFTVSEHPKCFIISLPTNCCHPSVLQKFLGKMTNDILFVSPVVTTMRPTTTTSTTTSTTSSTTPSTTISTTPSTMPSTPALTTTSATLSTPTLTTTSTTLSTTSSTPASTTRIPPTTTTSFTTPPVIMHLSYPIAIWFFY